MRRGIEARWFTLGPEAGLDYMDRGLARNIGSRRAIRRSKRIKRLPPYIP